MSDQETNEALMELPKTEEKPQKPEAPKQEETFRGELRSFLRKNRRAFIGALAGVLFACLCMWLGFMKTFFIALMAAIGAFLFAVDNKQAIFKRIIGKLFPPKN